MKKLNIVLVKQVGPNNCWAACLSMALQVFNIKRTEGQLDAMFNANGQGLDLFTMNQDFTVCFPKLQTNYLSAIVNLSPVLTFNEIKAQIDNNQPIIMGVQNYNGHAAHALLIYGYDEKTQTVFLADPWTGQEVQYSYADLVKLIWVETLIITQ